MSTANTMASITLLAIAFVLLFESVVSPVTSSTVLCLLSVLIIAYSVRKLLQPDQQV